MHLSLRLKTIADCVSHRSLADIGTDHAYIPIYLARKGRIDSAAACDIKRGPLAKAEEHIKNYGLENIIGTRLSNGLEKIRIGEFETAVLAGMGGMLIIDIMKAYPECARSFNELILQPQLDVVAVRKFLHKANYKIADERIIFDSGKYYNIILCSPCMDDQCDCPYTETEYMFGKRLMDKQDMILKNYVIHKINKTNNILSKISDDNSKKAELISLIKMYKEVMECL